MSIAKERREKNIEDHRNKSIESVNKWDDFRQRREFEID